MPLSPHLLNRRRDRQTTRLTNEAANLRRAAAQPVAPQPPLIPAAWSVWMTAWDPAAERRELKALTQPPAPLASIYKRHADWLDATVAQFEQQLAVIVEKATRATDQYLKEQLTVDAGVIAETPANLRAIRNLNDVFMRALDDAGYQELLTSFTGQFTGQLPFFQETLAFLSSTMQTPLPPVDFTAEDLRVFAAFRLSAISQIETAMEAAAGRAMSQVMFSLAGMPFSALVSTLAETFEHSVPKAVTLADTALATFYRTASARGYSQIEESLPEAVVRYSYGGPSDKLERPFCRRLTDAGSTYTRAEIARMNNGMLPNVFVTCGGWNCRHSWLLSLSFPSTQ